MKSVAELIASGKVPSTTTPSHNMAGYPDGWPIFTELAAQVKYDWDYLPSDRLKLLKGNAEYRAALETMLTGKPAVADASSEIPGAAGAAPVSPEEEIINAGSEPQPSPEPEGTEIAPAPEPEPEPEVVVPVEEPEGTKLEYPFGSLTKVKGGWEAKVDNNDGSGVQTYRAKTKDELIGKLMQAQAHATAKIRQQEEEKLRLLADEPADPAVSRKRLAPRALTADEQFEFAEAMSSGDPIRINKAMQKRDEIVLGGSVQEVIGAVNETRDYQEIESYKAIAKTFIRQNPDVKLTKEVGDKLDAILAENGWGYTVRNLNKALAQLKANGEVEQKVSTPVEEEPAIPVPTSTEPAKPATSAAPAKPAAPAAKTNQPAVGAPKQSDARLRPGSASTGVSPRQASVRPGVAPEVKAVGLTAEAYNRMSVSETRQKYKTDPGFRAAVDKLIAEGKI